MIDKIAPCSMDEATGYSSWSDPSFDPSGVRKRRDKYDLRLRQLAKLYLAQRSCERRGGSEGGDSRGQVPAACDVTPRQAICRAEGEKGASSWQSSQSPRKKAAATVALQSEVSQGLNQTEQNIEDVKIVLSDGDRMADDGDCGSDASGPAGQPASAAQRGWDQYRNTNIDGGLQVARRR